MADSSEPLLRFDGASAWTMLSAEDRAAIGAIALEYVIARNGLDLYSDVDGGEWAPGHPNELDEDLTGNCAYGEWHADGEFIRSCLCREGTQSVYRLGKRAAGRLLDVREHNEMPERAK